MEGRLSKMCSGVYKRKEVEKSVIRYDVPRGLLQNIFVEYFLCIDSPKYTRASPPARKMLFSSIIIMIILSYVIIRI